MTTDEIPHPDREMPDELMSELEGIFNNPAISEEVTDMASKEMTDEMRLQLADQMADKLMRGERLGRSWETMSPTDKIRKIALFVSNSSLDEIQAAELTEISDYDHEVLFSKAEKDSVVLEALEDAVHEIGHDASIADLINYCMSQLQIIGFGSAGEADQARHLQPLLDFLKNFKNANDLENYYQDNFSFRTWLEQ